MLRLRPPSRRTDPTQRRAFALPLVIVLALAASLAVVVLLERQSTATLTVRRQIDAYHSHHISFGMREMVSKWLRQFRGSVEDNLDSDGRAFSLQLPGGNTVSVYIEDAQGLALSDPSQFVGRRREILEFMSGYIQTRSRPEDVDKLLRPVGPDMICVTTAPREVLVALASAIVSEGEVPIVVDALESIANGTDSSSGGGTTLGSDPAGIDGVSGASSSRVARNGTNAVLADLNISDDAKRELIAMTTTRPTLYRVVCVEEDSRGPLWRAGGFMEINNTATSDVFDQGGPFLSWEQLPLE